MLAACSDHATLVAAGADVNACNNLGISAHMVAAESGNREPAAALLAAGADRGLRDKRRATREGCRHCAGCWTCGSCRAAAMKPTMRKEGRGGHEFCGLVPAATRDPSSRRSISRFADLKRRPGFFAVADHFAANGPCEVTVWCSTIISAWASTQRGINGHARARGD
jgi:hypothetical protein